MNKKIKKLLTIISIIFAGAIGLSLSSCISDGISPKPTPVDPGTDPSDPGKDPVDPGTDPVDPGTDPVDPGTDPVDPGTDPVDPGTDPVDPGTDPVDPTISKLTTKTKLDYTYKDYAAGNTYCFDFCPTIGNPKVIIIPIWFSDSSNYINSSKKETIRQDIEKAYLGSKDDTGWHSVKTFYEEESGGKMHLNGVVSEWRSVNYTTSQLGQDSYGEIVDELVRTSTDWFFENNSTYSRSEFDTDNNGYLDGVLLIYGAPDYSALNKDSWSNLWAYCYWLQEENETSQPIPNVYFWASYDFMYSSGSTASNKTGKSSAGSGDTSHCKIDAHTFIHEMGHVLGLDDYYDYGNNQYSPAGGFSMQDCNVGGHDAFSVMAFGWADPYIVTEDVEVTIGAFTETKDVVMIPANTSGTNSPFDEYILLELFTPTGVNQLDCTYTYASYLKGPNKTGIRMWHVDARLAYSTSTKVVDGYDEPVYKATQLTTNPLDDRATYGVYQAFSNSYDDKTYGSVLGSSYYNYNILQLIRNDETMSHKTTYTLESSDLFTSDTYQLADYSKQFVKGTKFNNGNSLDYTIKVEITGSGASAQAKLTITK